MQTRRVLIGCALVVLVLIGLAVVSGVAVFYRLSGRAPLLPATQFIDENSVGVAAARLSPDDPWVRDLFGKLARHSLRDPDPNEMLPAEAVWTARSRDDGGEDHVVSLSLSPKGKLAGMLFDVGLWKAGHSPDGHVQRVEFGGEGITSFPGTPFPGQVFIRDNNFVWTSGLDAAKRAVTRMTAPPQPPSPDAPLLALLPDPGETTHGFHGAIINRHGSLARALTLVPGEALDLPEELLAPVTSMTFFLDTDSASTGSGQVRLLFDGETPPETVQTLTTELAAHFESLRIASLSIEADVLPDHPGTIAIRLEGLDGLIDWIERGTDGIRTTIETGVPPEPR